MKRAPQKLLSSETKAMQEAAHADGAHRDFWTLIHSVLIMQNGEKP